MTLEHLIEFIKITIISLEQDLEGLVEEMDKLDPSSKDYAALDIEHTFISGQKVGMSYILRQALGEE